MASGSAEIIRNAETSCPVLAGGLRMTQRRKAARTNFLPTANTTPRHAATTTTV